MFKKSVLELIFSSDDKKLLHAVHDALIPETKTLVPNCAVDLHLKNNNELFLIITCNKINLLRALHNSFLSTISMLLHVYNEVIKA